MAVADKSAANRRLSAEDQRETLNRRRRAEVQREAFLASLRPDIVIVASLFEGFEDDGVTSVKRYTTIPTAVVLDDLIPFIDREAYQSASWHHEKLAQLRQADLLLAFSNSLRVEDMDLLGVDPERIVSIGAGPDPYFRAVQLSQSHFDRLHKHYGLKSNFLMYVGAFDQRENIDGLIRAYAGLPRSLRLKHQLALIGPDSIERPRLKSLALTIGLESEELVLPEYVSDDDLLILYNACSALVIPGLRESFDLPALEAMQCGKAVIAWNTSSMPEEVGRPDAPSNDAFITASLKRVMEDDVFRAELERNGPTQTAKFSWDNSAQRATAAIENALEKLKFAKSQPHFPQRKRLAFVSPLPPERSGISDYSAELLPALHSIYEVDVITDQPQISGDWILANCRQRGVRWFRAHFREYDRILYQFGNSEFHEHMVELLDIAPGPVVFHDFFLSGLQGCRGSDLFLRALKDSHGYKAVMESLLSTERAMYNYPANLAVLQNARGVIVHSETHVGWQGNGMAPVLVTNSR